MLQLGKFLGVPIEFHWSTLFMPMAAYNLFGLSWTGLAFAVCIVLSVFLHEFGHILAARQFGAGTSHVTFSWFGGAAHIQRTLSFQKEIWVLLAGPAVNLLIALLLWASFYASFFTVFSGYLLVLNVGLAIFNLLPIYPLDGGQILHHLIAIRKGRRKAQKFMFPFSVGLVLSIMLASILFFGIAGSIRLVLFGLVGIYFLYVWNKNQE
jgi:Zn-dependent protease